MKIKFIYIFLSVILIMFLSAIEIPQEPVQDTTKTKRAIPDSLKSDTLTRGYSNQLERFKKATPKKDKK